MDHYTAVVSVHRSETAGKIPREKKDCRCISHSPSDHDKTERTTEEIGKVVVRASTLEALKKKIGPLVELI